MSWQNNLFDILKNDGITIFSYVPDAGHKILIDRAISDNSISAIPLTSEQEGIGIAAGAYLGGSKAVLLMQSSGVGNCINQLSLIKHGQFPFLTIISMRGEFGEGNPWQYAMGEAVIPSLEAIGVKCLQVYNENDVEEMGYFDAFGTDEVDWADLYSGWVEKKILTEGQDRLVENTLGLVGEAGEVAEKIKKLIRDNNKYANEEIMKELGDVVFYATALANIYGRGLQEVLELNIQKLDDRQKRNKLRGSGDNR